MTQEQAAIFFVEFFKDFYWDLALMALISGFVGAMCYGLLTDLGESISQKLFAKSRARAWKKRQDMAKAEQGAQPRGDDVAGRACETRSGGAA